MANLERRQVFDDLFDFRRNFDHMFNRFLTGSGTSDERASRMLVTVPPIEAWMDKDNKNYHLNIALPGIDSKELKVELQGDNLTVSGEHQANEEKKEADYLHQEFSYGRFERTIVLPESADSSKVSAEYSNGVLEIVVPLSEAALPKQIEVKSPPRAKGAGA